jgi:uncharacterized protein (TIGR03437 family)
MPRSFILFGIFTVFAAAGYSQPTINQGGFVNAASYAAGPVARGAFFALFGQNLAGGTAQSVAPYPTTLGGTTVNISPASGGSPIPAYLFFVSPGQINGILPSKVPEGDATVAVTANGQTSASLAITVVHSRFGIFTGDFSGGGQAILQLYNSPTELPLNGLAHAAHDGQTAILWGTGLGPLASADDNHPDQENLASSVKVLINGQPIRPFYAGRSAYPGEDQINFTLPSGIPDDCYLSISVETGSTISNFATMSKATGTYGCDRPLHLPDSLLAKLDSGGSISVGLFAVTTLSGQVYTDQTISGRMQSVTGGFGIYNKSALYSMQEAAQLVPLTTAGSCVAFDVTIPIDPNDVAGSAVKGVESGLLFGKVTDLDAGAHLLLNGPGGASAPVPKSPPGYYADLSESESDQLPLAPDFLSSGSWMISGTGGQDVSAFQASFSIPRMLNVTAAPLVINRNQPYSVSWTGGGTGDSDYVSVVGVSTGPDVTTPGLHTIGVFFCTALARAGQFTVPANITAQLPAEIFGQNAFGVVLLQAATSAGANAFTAPLVAGGNIDAGFVIYQDDYIAGVSVK